MIVVACLNPAGPAIVKPNLTELETLAGRPLPAATAADPVAGEFRSGDYLGALDAVLVEEVTVEGAR